MRYGRNGRHFPVEINYKTLIYLKNFLSQHRDNGLRDNAEKRRCYDLAIDRINRSIRKAQDIFIAQGTKPRSYYFNKGE